VRLRGRRRVTKSTNAWTTSLAIGGLLALASCQKERAPESGPSHPPGEIWLSPERVSQSGIVVSPVSEQWVGDAIVTSGRVIFDDTRVAHVFSPVNGRVISLQATLGARVDKGTPLASLASPDLGQFFSDLVKAKADVGAAKSEFERQKELFDAHAGAKRDLEAAQNNFERTEAELQRAQEKIRLLSPNGQDSVTQEYLLRSPLAGEVIARNVNPGAEVQGQYSGGTAVELFTIGELDSVWVLADLYEVDLNRVKNGDLATVRVVTYPDKVFPGKVNWVSGALDPVSHTAKVRLEIANPNRELRPEMFATVSVFLDRTRALAIPRNALLRLGSDTVVFVEKGESDKYLQFERRLVTVREDGAGDFIPVLKGLAANERIVTQGAIFLAGAAAS
jgi:cobalt-zinc-cadmium efflux system membrane fusion protein